MTVFRAVFGVLFLLLLMVSPLKPLPADAQPSCPDVVVLGSRGSGETLTDRPVSLAGARFFGELTRLLPGKRVDLWPNPYPAVPIFRPTSPENDGGWLDLINAIGAGLNTKWIGKYLDSVEQGEDLLTAKINDTIRDCATTQLMLTGYSQGGQLTANVYQRLTATQRSHILGVVLFGEPLFNGSDDAVNRGDYDPERDGILPLAPRGEYPDPQKVLSYCHSLDPICQGFYLWKMTSTLTKTFDFSRHRQYVDVGDGPGQPAYPDAAAEYFANRVRPAPAPVRPDAEITALDDQAPGVLFRVSGCATEAHGRPLTYDWDLDNSGRFATRTPGCVLRTSFATTGDYPIALRVTNDAGQQHTATAVVHVVSPGAFTGVPLAPTQVVSTPEFGVGATLRWQPPATGPPVEAYRVFADDGTILATVEHGGAGSFFVPAEDLPLAVRVQSINRAGDGGGTSPPVTMFVAGALPDDDLNRMWNAYGDQGGHWTGADSTVSVELPGGRIAWLFSDTFLGTVNPDGSRPRSAPFIRNSIVLQQDNALATLHGGTPENPRTLVERPDDDGFLWVGDGTVENNQLKVLYNRYVSVGSDPLDVRQSGAFLATFALPDVTLTGITDLGRGADISWNSFHEESDFTYIYGTKTENDVKFLHIARAPAGNIGGVWEFWTGQGWSSSESASARVMSGIDTLSVTKVGDRYVMFAQDADGFFSPDIVAYFGPSPTGPFTDKTYLYSAPEPGQLPAAIVYGVQLHPEFGAPGKFVLSYNVNSLDEDANYANARIYRPRFIKVALPGTAPNPNDLPRPPTNLRATTDNQGVHLTWTASPTPGVSYRVYQRDVTGGQTGAARVGGPVTGTAYNPRFLKNDRTYEFYVTAVNNAGESPPSNTVTAVPQVRPPAAAPTGLSARPNPDGTITLAWVGVPDALWYRISFKDDGTPSDFDVLNRNITATNYTMKNLVSGHTYTFKVAGYTEGGAGPNSAPVTATARIALPPAPTNLTATANDGDCTIRLMWTASPDLWFWIYQRDVTAGETDFTRLTYPVVSGTTFTAGLLSNGHAYEFQVSGINGGGEGPRSTVVRATAKCSPPDAPTNLVALPGNSEVRLTWTPPNPSNVWYWFYQRNVTAKEATFTRLPYPKTDGGTTFTAGLLANGQTYEFYITAINQAGEGPPSNIARATPNPPLPAAPTGLSATANGDASVTLTWNAPEPNAWYWVYRRDVTAGETGFTRGTYPVTDGTTNRPGSLYGGHTYEWRVSAINSAGEGPLSNVARATARIDPPRDLVATATSDGKAQLSWTGPGDDFWYYLYMRDASAGQPFTRNDIPITTGNGHVVDWLQNGHVYEFYLTALGPGGGESGPSNIAQITAHGGTPPAPSLTARAGDGRVDLSWNATGDLYWIYKRCFSCGDTNYQKLGLPVGGTTFTDTGVINGFTFEYRVSAVNVHGEGGWSNAARARPLPPLPGAPTGLTAQAGDGHVLLRWNAPGPNLWYYVYYRDATANQDGFSRTAYPITSGTSFDMIWLANAHTYEFFVTAINVAGEGPRSGIVSARPLPPFPSPPLDLTFSYDGQTSGTLNWAPSTPPQVYYWVWMRDVSRSEGFHRLAYPTAQTRASIIMLILGHRYEFFVVAENLAGVSAGSNFVSVNPGPRDGASGCASAAGNGTPDGRFVYNSMRATVCGNRHGDFFDISGDWTSSGRHVNDLSIQYGLWNCRTGSLAWWDYISYENNPPNTSGSRFWSIYVYSGDYYAVRVTGGVHLEEPFGNGYLNTVASRYPPPHVPPFIALSYCF